MPTRETAHDVTAWRRERLERAGFPPSLAGRLAGERGRDLHQLIELAERGCPHRLAERITAPAGPDDRPGAA
ncbi:MAG: hypothetical protein QOD86_1589 [Miltoncostaeaceae bacterium]|jgi:hypothetical protein|nr:hypothetical protein [Miltoncostaeaceae bacterium]